MDIFSAPRKGLYTMGATQLDLLSCIVLNCSATLSNNAGYSVLCQGPTPYIVPAGRTLHVVAAQIAGTWSGDNSHTLNYGTTSVGQNSASGPTGNTVAGANTTASEILNTPVAASVSAVVQKGGFDFQIPAANYPTIQINARANATISANIFVLCWLA